MGHKIKQFTRDELHRVSLPGTVASSLFWVLPTGNWKPNELDVWWQHFTKNDGICNRYGMLLVQDGSLRRTGKSADTIEFGNVIPNFRHLNSRLADDNKSLRSIFVTSAVYPHPGWGVMVDLPLEWIEKPAEFEKSLLKVAFKHSHFEEADLAKIIKASDTYKKKEQILLERPQRAPLSVEREQEHEQIRKKYRLIENILKATQQHQFDECLKLLDRASSFEGLAPKRLVGIVKAFTRVRITHEKEPETLNRLFTELRASNSEARYESLLQNAPQREGGILRSLHQLLSQLDCDFRETPEEAFLSFTTKTECHINETLAPQLRHLQEQLIKIEGEGSLAEETYRKERTEYRKKSNEAEKQLRLAIAEAATIQWRCGPTFLKNFEDQARAQGIESRSIKWEPVRMVGWKLLTTFPNIASIDLLAEVNTALETTTIDITDDPSLDGSLFADYIYYMVTESDKLSPREATHRIIDRLLLTSQVRHELGNGGAPETLNLAQEKPQLVDQLLTHWGWPTAPKEATFPILRCIDPISGGKHRLSRESNETRIILEGYFKDLVQVTFNQLGYSGPKIVSEIQDRLPGFRWDSSSEHMDRGECDALWQETLEKLTSGAAGLLLREFLPLAFPLKSEAIQKFLKASSPIREALNKGSHYPPIELSDENRLQYGTQIFELLQLANEIIEEFPWHFTPKQVIGNAPQIVTGYAWSHSHREERMIRILVDNQRINDLTPLLVWNPSKVNPVMPDARIL